MLASHTQQRNHFLAALPADDYARLLPGQEQLPLQLGLALHESGTQQGHVHFPSTSIVALLYVMEDGSSAESAVVGNEGVTEAAGHLQSAGLIHYSRGRIALLDRPKLEARARECYAVVKRESDRLLAPRNAIVATPVADR